MCLAVSAKLLSREGAMGKAEISGLTRDISLMLLPEAKPGDYVLVHAGFAMQVVSPEDFAERAALAAEMNGAPRTVTKLRDETGLSYAGT